MFLLKFFPLSLYENDIWRKNRKDFYLYVSSGRKKKESIKNKKKTGNNSPFPTHHFFWGKGKEWRRKVEKEWRITWHNLEQEF